MQEEKANKNILPVHIAIIPDANRRWAKKRGMKPWVGHLWGARNIQRILKEALNMKIKCVSFWGGSYDNLTKRPEMEIKYLFKIYGDYIVKPLKRKEIQKYGVRVKVLGRHKELLPQSTLKEIEKLERETKDNGNYYINILIGYNGTDEMLDAVRRIAAKNLKTEQITEETIKQNLWTHETPPVDLIIRTGSGHDPHNSAGFMMFDTAYSQYYFTKTMWPDFSPEEFRKAVEKLMKTDRRGGK